MSANVYWYVSRGSGIVAYLLLTAAVCLGVALSRRWRPGDVPRLLMDEAHRWLALVFYAFVAVHVVTIYLDSFSHFNVLDVLVPFASDYRPFWIGLGVIALELAVAIGASVWARRWIGYRAWHALHGLNYLVFAMALLHGLWLGSDSGAAWAIALYVSSLVAVLAASAWRVAALGTWRRPALTTAVVGGGLVLALALASWT
jgi:DMSO/TMAO reductase YedYZ heme-binding membrane subunit